MAVILRQWRIVFATCFSALLVVGAYWAAQGTLHPPVAEASTEIELLRAIANRDSTGDGLPDWEKQLYGIPLNATTTDYFGLGMTDGEAVARGLIVPKAIATAPQESTDSSVDPSLPAAPATGTLTDTFARNFFSLYITTREQKGGELTQDDLDGIVTQLLDQLSSSVAPAQPFRKSSDLTVSGSGSSALQDFAVRAEAVFNANSSTASKSEIEYLKDVVQGNDNSALAHITSIGETYRKIAMGLAVLAVPSDLAATDLALINSLMRISEICTDFARVNDDPLAAMLALRQYPQAVLDMGTAFIAVGKTYRTAGINLQTGTPGAGFINLMNEVAESQASASKP